MSQLQTDVQDHPLMITLQDTVTGEGFLAKITLSGRTLMRHEDDKWWMYGVRPAAIAESGSTVREAFLSFRQAYKNALFDMAKLSESFADFRTRVEGFFNEADSDSDAWEQALKDIRDGQIVPPASFSDLPRQTPDDRPARIEVERLDDQLKPFVPSDNVSDAVSLAYRKAA